MGKCVKTVLGDGAPVLNKQEEAENGGCLRRSQERQVGHGECQAGEHLGTHGDDAGQFGDQGSYVIASPQEIENVGITPLAPHVPQNKVLGPQKHPKKMNNQKNR
eukprot:2108430-Amphidinium_carterae.1